MLAEVALLAVLSVEHGHGAEDCVERSRLERSVERRLKRRVFVDAAEADLRLAVVFARNGERIEARIRLWSRDGKARGTRSLVTTGHCSKLDDSLALSLALLVDEPPEPEPSESTPAGPSGAPAAPSAIPAQPARVDPSSTTHVIEIPPEVAASREPWHVAFGAAAKGAMGFLPGIVPAAALSLRLVPPLFPDILITGDAYWPADAERDATSGARFRLLGVGLSLCPTLFKGERGGVALCAGQEVRWLRVEGYGFDHDASQRRLLYSLTLAGEGRLRLFAPVSLRGALGLELPLVRDRFASAGRDARELFRPSPLGLFVEIGLEATLW